MEMNTQERVALLLAMDTVVRSLNDETYMDAWLESGVPDGTVYEDLIDYTDDEIFADIMDTFVYVMARAITGEFVGKERRRGILYCDRVISEDLELIDKGD